MIDQIKNVLESVLLISVKNLSLELSTDISMLTPALYQLEKEHLIRISNGKSCGSSCSSCGDSCETEKVKRSIHDGTILISLIQKHQRAVDE